MNDRSTIKHYVYIDVEFVSVPPAEYNSAYQIISTDHIKSQNDIDELNHLWHFVVKILQSIFLEEEMVLEYTDRFNEVPAYENESKNADFHHIIMGFPYYGYDDNEYFENFNDPRIFQLEVFSQSCDQLKQKDVNDYMQRINTDGRLQASIDPYFYWEEKENV